MGDPGLVAVDLVDVALAHGAGLQRSQIRAGIRLGEYGGRQHLAGADFRQPFALLLLGAAAENKLGGDLGAGAERADADIAARKLLGHDAHQFLAEPHAAVFLGDGQREHAELGHLRDDVERNVLIAQMPALRMRHHLAVGEFAHLVANGIEGVVEAGRADARIRLLPHQFAKPRAALRGVAVNDQMLDGGIDARGHHRAGDAEVAKPDDLALAHRNAADDLRQIFAGADPHQEILDLAETAGRAKPLRVGRKLADRLDIGGEPGKPVGGALLLVEQSRVGAAVPHHLFGDGPLRVAKQRLGGVGRLRKRRDQLVFGGLGRCGKRHKRLR